MAAPSLPTDERAAALLGPLLPIRARSTGLVLLVLTEVRRWDPDAGTVTS